jgi:predicted lipoprotein with Yx(FWY)xxD motif
MTKLMTRRVWGAVGAVGLIMLAAACGSSSAASTSGSAPSTSAPAASAPAVAAAPASPSAAPLAVLKTEQTALGMVLTNAQGFTVYWFAKDSSTASLCAGACASAWPPVLGMARAESGVKLSGTLGEIKRPNGTMQATYDGHPLYLYVGDQAPGQANGNGVDGFGALWYAFKIGTATTANTGTSSGSGGSGSGSSGSGGSGSGDMGGSGSGGMGGSGSGGMGGSGGGGGGW